MKLIENDYYSEEVHGTYEIFSLGDFKLLSGGTLRDCKLAFKTFGKLNKEKDNVILFPHMYSGTHKAMEAYIERGAALDPEKYFIILPNQLGGGLSSSPHNTPPPFNQAAFPLLTISDDVLAQHKLVKEKFGIEKR